MTNYVTVWNEVEHSSEFLENPKEIFLWYYMDSDASNYVQNFNHTCGARSVLSNGKKWEETGNVFFITSPSTNHERLTIMSDNRQIKYRTFYYRSHQISPLSLYTITDVNGSIY